MDKRKCTPTPQDESTARNMTPPEPWLRACHDRLQQWGIPEDYWPFYDGTANSAADWDDPYWAIIAADAFRILVDCLPLHWELPRTQSNVQCMGETGGALQLAMNRIFFVAPVLLSDSERDRLQKGYAKIKAGLKSYFETNEEIRRAGGDSGPTGVDLTDQWVQANHSNPQLAEVLLATHKANPFRDASIEDLVCDGGIIHRLLPKLKQDLNAAQGGEAAPGRPGRIPEEGQQRKRAVFKWGDLCLASLVALVLIGLFEWIVYGVPWNWVKNHPASIGIQVSAGLLIAACTLGLFVPPLRKYAWSSAVLVGLVLVILSRL